MNIIQMKSKFKSSLLAIMLLIALLVTSDSYAAQYQFIYTSDQHYGIDRKEFRGEKNVNARKVNAAMASAINSLPEVSFPNDDGLRAGEKINWADFVISTGDIANRMEGNDPLVVPNAEECWAQFEQQYLNGVKVKNSEGKIAEIIVIPGNHDATNAVGFYREMTPNVDNRSVLAMYNRANNTELSSKAFDYNKHKVNLRRDLGDIRLLFVQMWPDNQARNWISEQLPQNSENTAVFLFTHDQPDVEAKHLINPNGKQDINAEDKFENLLSQVASIKSTKEVPVNEHKELADYFKAHPSIVAYFHGNENYNEFYNWTGPENNINMPTFRVDSPMKGNESSKDETKLSFQIVTIDTDTNKMSVREVLWNANPADPQITWGESKTISYR